MRRRAKPPQAKVEAKLPVRRKSRKNEDSRVGDLERRLAEALKREAEALDQQTATAEILRVISRSPGDLQPVLNAVAEHAARLCDARDVIILRTDGDVLRMAASVGNLAAPVGRDLRSDFGFPITRGSVSGRAVVDRATLHVQDLAAESDTEFPTGKELQRRFGHRTMLATPLLRDDTALGVICVFRTEVRPFSDSQIELLKTFADQAVIAMENVRLFDETREALEQQTATSEVLRVISSSPTDVQPVFDAILRDAVRLCGGVYGMIWRYDGEVVDLAGVDNFPAADFEEVRSRFPRLIGENDDIHKAVRSGRVIDIPDVEGAAHFRLPIESWRRRSVRSVVVVPMQRETQVVGAIGVSHRAVGAFSDGRIGLLKTFADQAVIAIENVRLFTELQQKNEALTQAHAQVSEALERQTATSEILRVIARSQTDMQPVFETIVRNAARLCNSVVAALFRTDGVMLEHPVNYGTTPEVFAAIARHYPMRLDAPNAIGSSIGRAILTRSVVQLTDAEGASVPAFTRSVARTVGFRSQLSVPMLRDGEAVGGIVVARREAGAFAEAEIELLKTFADQAVIAIENVRLFNELQEKNRALTEAHAHVTETLERQTATSEILRVISRPRRVPSSPCCAPRARRAPDRRTHGVPEGAR